MAVKPTTAAGLKAAEKQAQAMELRKAGCTFEEIARQLGYSHHTGARNAVVAGLRRTLTEPAEELRTLQRERLRKLWLALYPRAIKGDEKAIDRCIRLHEQMVALDGLNKATKMEVTGKDGGPIEHADVTAERARELVKQKLEHLRKRMTGVDLVPAPSEN